MAGKLLALSCKMRWKMQDSWVKPFPCHRQHHKLLVLCPKMIVLCCVSFQFILIGSMSVGIPFILVESNESTLPLVVHPWSIFYPLSFFAFLLVNSIQIDALAYVCMCASERWCRCADNHDERRKWCICSDQSLLSERWLYCISQCPHEVKAMFCQNW